MRYPVRWLSCFKAGHRKSAREFIDEELATSLLKKVIASKYTDTESMKVLDFIHKFNSEFHKNVVKKGDSLALHNTDVLRKDCYARENARNRDISSRENRFLVSTEPQLIAGTDGDLRLDAFLNTARDLRNHENGIIELIDRLDELEGLIATKDQ